MSTPFRFVITRTSFWSYSEDAPPVPGLTWLPIPLEERGEWVGVPGVWVKEFASVQDLMAFVDEHGDVVILPKSNYQEARFDVLEIYDGYRE